MSWLSKISGRGKDEASGGAGAKARPSGPPGIIVDRHEYKVEEFAIGSFRVRPYEGDLIAKQQFDFRIFFELDGERQEIMCHGVVVRSNSEQGLVARYQRPQPFYEAKLIEYLKRWKGL